MHGAAAKGDLPILRYFGFKKGPVSIRWTVRVTVPLK